MADTAADRSRRPAWWPLAVSALVVPTVLAGLTLLWPRPQIEQELTRSSGDALAAAGFAGAGLSLSGRDATISGVPAAEGPRAIDVVQGVTGVRIAALSGFPDGARPAGPAGSAGSAAPTGAGGAVVAAQPFGVSRLEDDLVVTGVVGSEDQRARLLAAVTAQADGRSVIDELSVTPGAPLPTGLDERSAGAAAAVLTTAEGDLSVDFASGGIALTGQVVNDAAKAAAGQGVIAAAPGVDVDNQLAVVPTPAVAPAGPGLDPAARAQLQATVDQIVASAPITFEPDSPQLTARGSATVARLLELLGPQTAARLQVDGFVASGPGRGILTAQQLSDQRATVVRDALVAGGIAADRITARGLGEGDTPTAPGAGRRVEITVS